MELKVFSMKDMFLNVSFFSVALSILKDARFVLFVSRLKKKKKKGFAYILRSEFFLNIRKINSTALEFQSL